MGCLFPFVSLILGRKNPLSGFFEALLLLSGFLLLFSLYFLTFLFFCRRYGSQSTGVKNLFSFSAVDMEVCGGLYARHREIDKKLHRVISREKHHIYRSFNQWRTAILSAFGYVPFSWKAVIFMTSLYLIPVVYSFQRRLCV